LPDPKATVVVTSYNYENFLARTIDSILQQTYPNIETIVVDDGSTDRSPAIIEGYGEQIRPVFKENGGQCSAVNAGYAVSTGDLAIFLDSDDALYPDAVASVVEAWSSEVAAVQYYLDIVDVDEKPMGSREPAGRMPSGDLRAKLFGFGAFPFANTGGAAFSRKVLEQVMPVPVEDFWTFVDYYLAMTAAALGPVVSLDRSLGFYRIHSANLSPVSGVAAEKLREELDADYKIAAILKSMGEGQGYEVDPDLPLRSPSHVKKRLVALRLDRAGHPWKDDTRLGLAWRLMVNAWRWPYYRLVTRLTVTLGAASLFVMPAALFRRSANFLSLHFRWPKFLGGLLR
jgi:glycosyltransferase involved in cell wall biosynthesis